MASASLRHTNRQVPDPYQMDCPHCGSTDTRSVPAQGLREHLIAPFGVYAFICQNCFKRFLRKPLGVFSIFYAKCPRCFRMDLSMWDPNRYYKGVWAQIRITLGANCWRCEVCRHNFVSFRPRRQHYVRPGPPAASAAQPALLEDAPVEAALPAPPAVAADPVTDPVTDAAPTAVPPIPDLAVVQPAPAQEPPPEPYELQAEPFKAPATRKPRKAPVRRSRKIGDEDPAQTTRTLETAPESPAPKPTRRRKSPAPPHAEAQPAPPSATAGSEPLDPALSIPAAAPKKRPAARRKPAPSPE